MFILTRPYIPADQLSYYYHLGITNLLLETDSPYLAPVPNRGRRNSPTYLPLISEKIANILEISPLKVSEITDNNALALFKLDEL
ncbi:MAG: TatD family hydrolase [Cyclobacteriaceae bacterium]